MNEGILIIGSGHSIMLGHLPNSVSLGRFSENSFKNKNNESISSFGLFGNDLNYNTYYPDVKPEEFKPSEDDFIEPVFRMLSSTIVSKGWYPVDFSRGNVLKDSMDLLVGQTVNCDHSTDVGNAIGSIKEVFWQEAYTQNGIKIPAGINAKLKIDGKANPRIARGIMMDPPSIHSNSVTVRFLWEKSHPEMEDYEFYDKCGTYDKEGNLICKVATKILSYHETSLVSHGADPYAQKIGSDGKIVNPVYANIAASQFSDKSCNNSKVGYTFNDLKGLPKVEVIHNTMVFNNELINFSPDGELNNNNKNNEESMNKELEMFISSLFGEGLLSLGEGKQKTPEEAISLIKDLVSSRTSLSSEVESLKKVKSDLEAQVIQLKADIENNSNLVNIGTTHLKEVRDKVTADYKKLMGQDNLDESMITLIANADINTLKSLGNSYTTQLEQKFPLKCDECGSHKVSRASSSPDSKEDTTENSEVTSTADLINSLREKSFKKK